jgi:cytoskeleton protein RodZ
VRNNDANPPAAASLGLGERLRSARKARALSVAQVSEALHLEESSVLALEEEQFETLGAPVFVRGHLRRYARVVGLAEEAILEAYRGIAPDSDRLPPLARPRTQGETVRVGGWVYWLAAALVIGGLLMSLFSTGNDQPVSPDDQPPPEATPDATLQEQAAPVPAPPSAVPDL